MTEILFAVSPSVFSWSVLSRELSSAAFLLPRPEKGTLWPIPRRTHPAQVEVIALAVKDVVSISRNAATGRATWRHVSSCPAWRFWTIKQSIGCSTPSPRSSAAKQWIVTTRSNDEEAYNNSQTSMHLLLILALKDCPPSHRKLRRLCFVENSDLKYSKRKNCHEKIFNSGIYVCTGGSWHIVIHILIWVDLKLPTGSLGTGKHAHRSSGYNTNKT